MKPKKHAPALIAVVAVFPGISPAWAFESRPSPSREQRGPAIVFPGGGLFFYWQAGVVTHLQETGYDLSMATMSGASAGALSATLAKTGVRPTDATELALQMSKENAVWERPMGLQGIWGSIIEDWLDRLLPDDAALRVDDGCLNIIVTPVPSFGKTRVSDFEDRSDLIRANMASVHLPWFLDGNLTTEYRGSACIDGSFLASPSDYLPDHDQDRQRLVVDFKRDPVMKDKAGEFIKVVSPQAIWDILDRGREYARIMERNGEFVCLEA